MPKGGIQIDISGLVVGYVTVTRAIQLIPGQGVLWEGRCICGATVAKKAAYFNRQKKTGTQMSCGCMRKITIGNATRKHGALKHPLYVIWDSMKKRCRTPSADNFEHYGGRGIQVCARWRDSFENFLSDMGSSFRPGLTLERIDNDGGYDALNCVWATKVEQMNNTRKNVHVATPGGIMTIAQASRQYEVPYHHLYRALKRDRVYRLSVGEIRDTR
jgi:hypothetical protein